MVSGISDLELSSVLSTSTGLGTSEICGDADFFPNGGHDMTGCSENRIDISNPTGESYDFKDKSARLFRIL